MGKSIILSADLLIREAEKLLRAHGLLAEQEAIGIIKVASDLIWNNANPDTDESLVYWITSKELYIAEYIGELHKEAIREYFAK